LAAAKREGLAIVCHWEDDYRFGIALVIVLRTLWYRLTRLRAN